MSIQITTLNVNGMGENSKRNAIFNWSRKQNFDVIKFASRKHIVLILSNQNTKKNGAGITEQKLRKVTGVAVLFKERFKYDVNVNIIDRTVGIYKVNLKLIPMKYLELQMYMYQTYPVTENVF